MLVHRRVIPSIKFAGTHLYIWVETGTVRVSKCLAQEHSTVTLAGYRPRTLTWGPFLERPGNLTGAKSYFEIKVSRKVECFLICDEVHFVL